MTTWNILFIGRSDGSLAGAVTERLDDLRATLGSVGASPDVRVFVQTVAQQGAVFARSWSELGAPGLVDGGALPALGEPAYITPFIEWTRGVRMPERELVWVLSHGFGGVLPGLETGSMANTAPDATGTLDGSGAGQQIDVSELRRALSPRLADGASRPVDILFLEACEQAGIEMAYAVRDRCDYLIASETRADERGLQHGEWLRWLLRDASQRPEALGHKVVASVAAASVGCLDALDPLRTSHSGHSACVVRLKDIEEIAREMEELVARVGDGERGSFRDAVYAPGDGRRDRSDLLSVLDALRRVPAFEGRSTRLRGLVQDALRTCFASGTNLKQEVMTGLSIATPSPSASDLFRSLLPPPQAGAEDPREWHFHRRVRWLDALAGPADIDSLTGDQTMTMKDKKLELLNAYRHLLGASLSADHYQADGKILATHSLTKLHESCHAAYQLSALAQRSPEQEATMRVALAQARGILRGAGVVSHTDDELDAVVRSLSFVMSAHAVPGDATSLSGSAAAPYVAPGDVLGY